jgi:hypothetical protein
MNGGILLFPLMPSWLKYARNNVSFNLSQKWCYLRLRGTKNVFGEKRKDCDGNVNSSETSRQM